VNGESIYGTSASPFFFPDITWRCTVKPGKVFLHLINWPGRNFRFEGLESQVKRAYFLADAKEVPFQRDGKAWTFTLPAAAPDPYDTVLALEIADQTPRVAAEHARDRLPARLDLYAWTARLRGEELHYDKTSMSANNFVKVPTEQNELWWYPYGSLQGDYSVEVTYACDDAVAGSAFRLGVHKGNRAPYASIQGRVEGTKGQFVTRRVDGTLRVTPDDQHISFALPDDDKSAGVRLRKITLVRKTS
jgi:hypothetical protein